MAEKEPMDVAEFINTLRSKPLYSSDARVQAAVEAAASAMEAAARDVAELRRLTDALHVQLQAILNPAPVVSKLEAMDQQWLTEMLERDYAESVATLNLMLDPSKGEVAPNKEAVRAAILRTLTPEQVVEIRKLREPMLLIVPDVEYERFEIAINKPECKNQGAVSEQTDAYIGSFYKTTMAETAAHYGVQAGQPINGYRFAIVEGAQHFDGTSASEPWNKCEEMQMENRIADFEAHYAAIGIQSMNAPAYMMLMMRGLRGGKPADAKGVDYKQWTVLAAEPKAAHVKDGCVACGCWISAQAEFGSDALTRRSDNVRLRASVMGRV